MSLKRYDVKVVGAGLAGAVMAERLAYHGNRVLVVDRRPHIAGNCYDENNEHGVLVHKYGPHIFRTNSPGVRDYLSQFTDWRPYEHRVLSRTSRGLLPVPVNATTLEKFYGMPDGALDDEHAAMEFLAQLQVLYPGGPKNSEEVCLSRVGHGLYEEMFKGYTMKQWGRHPRELDASVCGRIPVRYDRDDRYFSEEFQAMPVDGYTAMVERMLDSPRIDVSLCTEAHGLASPEAPQTVWTGCIDQAYDYAFGALPWRSLRFENKSMDTNGALVQPAAVINEPDIGLPWTRRTEYRWLTGQEHRMTTIGYEFPIGVDEGGEPYYPVPSPDSKALLHDYMELAKHHHGWTFVGRLARYQYLEMGQVVGQALRTSRDLCQRLTLANMP